MKKLALMVLMSCAIAIAPIRGDIAKSPAVSIVSKNGDGLSIVMAGGRLRLWPVAKNTVRVTFTVEDDFSDRESLVVVSKLDTEVEWTVEEDKNTVRLVMNEISVEVCRDTGALTFKNSSGKVLLAEPDRNSREVKHVQISGEDAYEIKQSFNFAAGEALYGLGQFEDGHLNSRGQDILLVQTNTIAVNPFLVSTRGYGILWDNYSKTVFNDEQGSTDRPSTGYLWSEMADGIDYYFIVGPELDKVVAGYRELTGRAPMFGKWAFGYWQSKERYKSFDELLDVVSEYRVLPSMASFAAVQSEQGRLGDADHEDHGLGRGQKLDKKFWRDGEYYWIGSGRGLRRHGSGGGGNNCNPVASSATRPITE